MGVTVTWELSGIVYREIRGTEILQLLRRGSDTPETDPVILRTLYQYGCISEYFLFSVL